MVVFKATPPLPLTRNPIIVRLSDEKMVTIEKVCERITVDKDIMG